MISVSRETQEKLDIYKNLLLKWQKAINLVSPSTLDNIQNRHFLDSLQLTPYIHDQAKVLYDIGSGAGFPGLVLAMASQFLNVTLIESDQRKCEFLKTVSREAEVAVRILNQRIEKTHIPAPDVITCRALASIKDLLFLTSQWWSENPHVVLLFLKGTKASEEIVQAREAFRFDVDIYPSKTDSKASVLLVKNVNNL